MKAEPYHIDFTKLKMNSSNHNIMDMIMNDINIDCYDSSDLIQNSSDLIQNSSDLILNTNDIHDGLIYDSKRFIVSFDYPHQSIKNHVLLLCNDNIVVIPPIKYIQQKTNKKKCFVKKLTFLTLLESNMTLCSANIVLGKKKIKIFFGKLLQEELEYELISNLIKKNACNILALDNLSDSLINEIMKKQFNEIVGVNTDFIIKNNKIIIGFNGY